MLTNDICYLKLQREHHNGHLNRVAKIHGCTDVSPPQTYGMKHLKTRAKQKQLQRDRDIYVQKSDQLHHQNLKEIRSKKSKEGTSISPLRINSANWKERIAEIDYINKNNCYMLKNLERTGSTMESPQQLKCRNDRLAQHRSLMTRKYFGVMQNKHVGRKAKCGSSDKKEETSNRPEWVGIGSQFDSSILDTVDPEDYALHPEEKQEKKSTMKKKKAKIDDELKKRPKPTNNYMKPKSTINFKVVIS